MFGDLREYLALLEKNGQLFRYTEAIDPEPELSLLACGAFDTGRDCPAVLVDNMKGHKGKRIAMNVHGSWTNLALCLGMEPQTDVRQMLYELPERWARYPGELTWTDAAPCHEVVIDDVNLLEQLPLFKVNSHDGAYYLCKTVSVTRDPDDPANDDKESGGIYLLAALDKDTIAMQAMPYNPAARHIKAAEERGENLPIAICIGNDPVLSMCCCADLPPDQSRFKMAAAIKGRPMVMTKTTDGYLNIPAGTEYVLEGEVVGRERIVAGPSGEFLGSYTDVRWQHKVRIKRITHRKDPIFENLYIGLHKGEVDALMGLNTCANVYTTLKETMPEVVAVNAVRCHGMTIVVALNPRFGGYAKTVAMRVASSPFGSPYAKNIILVDGDVDPFDWDQVTWAMSCRIRGAQDVIVIPSTCGMPLDPSSNPPGMGFKVIIDATTPVHPEPLLRDARLIDRMGAAKKYEDIIARAKKAVK